MNSDFSSTTVSSPCAGRSSLTPSSDTAVSFVPEPVRLWPTEPPRGLLASRNRLVCEGGIAGAGGKATSGGGSRGGSGRTEEARGLPTIGCGMRFGGRVDVRVRVVCVLVGEDSRELA